MTNLHNLDENPSILKYTQPFTNGIQPFHLTRHAVGYVMRGEKNIYYGDTCYQIQRGEVFYFSTGNHYVKDLPSNNKPFEQVVFYYTTKELCSILIRLNQAHLMKVSNDHVCYNCKDMAHVNFPAWTTLRNFFLTTNQNIKAGPSAMNKISESYKKTELIYLLLSQNNPCMKNKLLSNLDVAREQFEQIIYSHIFEDISINKLSSECNRSLTTFKKEFKRHFFMPPHQWFLKQRLMHSRLLLISTSKSVSEICAECNFTNTSHFIKLFKKEFNKTPAIYRHEREAITKDSACSLHPMSVAGSESGHFERIE